ncbi:MAG TPA: hypothetical protein HA304_04440 [Methanosarcinales archaeon]|nr:hypothetical protein [Methanosarcinales archaeon]
MEKTDVYGRIESFDQSVRSIDRRLRAVERRLSTGKDDYIRTDPESSENIHWTDPDIEELQAGYKELRAECNELYDAIEIVTSGLAAIKSNELTQLNSSVDALRQELQAASSRIEELGGQQTSLKEKTSASVESINNAHISQIETLSKELEDTKKRLQRQENMNKITIGNVKVPVELSGIVASVALIATGCLVWADRWDIIRSTYYPTGLALLFAAAVIAKFIITNRHFDTS